MKIGVINEVTTRKKNPDIISALKTIKRDNIVIIKEGYNQDNYCKMAEKYISDYYRRYDPFDQGKTIAIEDRILISLDNSGYYKLQGYIDRLTEIKDGFYEIHDYPFCVQSNTKHTVLYGCFFNETST